MAADYRHIDGLENRLGRHYSRFPPFSLTPALADQSLALRKLRDAGSNRRSRARTTQRLCAHETENPVSHVGRGAGHDCPSIDMKNRRDRSRLVLAVHPTTRGFGFVVFEDRQTIDWGVKCVCGDKNRKALAKRIGSSRILPSLIVNSTNVPTSSFSARAISGGTVNCIFCLMRRIGFVLKWFFVIEVRRLEG